jgi:hypothetical protein
MMASSRRREAASGGAPFAIYAATAGNAVFGGLTGVGIPVALSGFGLAKIDIATFFVVNSGFAIVYNLMVMPWIQRRGNRQWFFVASSAAIPLGLGAILLGRGFAPLLYVGGALMMFVATIIPQIFSRIAARQEVSSPEAVVGRLRQLLVAGYILGLALYAIVSAIGASPLFVALVVSAGTTFVALAPSFRIRSTHRFGGESVEVGGRVRTGRLVLLAVSLVALMKCVDALRMIYLPLYSSVNGLSGSSISALFLIASICELAAIPLLARMSSRWGPARTLTVIGSVGAAAFVAPLMESPYGVLAASQVLYAVFGAGFQSIGLVLLANVLRGDVGRGASSYMATIQIGTMLGAVLPLFVPGYEPSLFFMAGAICLLCVGLSVVLNAAMPSSRPAR